MNVLRKTTLRRRSLGTLLALSFAAPAAHAAPLYWDGSGTGWDVASNWSTSQTAATPDPGAVPGNADTATFVATTATGAQTVNLNGPQAALGLAVNSSNSFITTLVGGTGDQTLSIGTGGISNASTGGGITIGSITAGQKVNLSLTGSQTWSSTASGTGAQALFVLNDVSLANAGAQTLTLTGNNSGSKIDGIISNGAGTLSLTKTSSGTWTLTGVNTYTGNTTISAGTLSMSVNRIASSPTISIGNGATLIGTSTVTGFILAANQNITGTGATGTVTANASLGLITTSGSTISSSGTLNITRFSVLGTGNQITGGNIQSGGATAGQRGLLVGNGNVGTLTITGGSFTSNGGSNGDVIGNGGSIGNGTLIINGGSYTNTASSGTTNLGFGSASGTITLTSGSATLGTLIYNAGTSGTQTSAIVNLDGGTLTLSGITVTSGTTKELNFNGGQFVAGASLPAFSGLKLNVKDGGAKIDTNGNSFAISDQLLTAGTGIGGLTKSGGGTLTLTGNNTYGGSTTINAGTLAINNASGSGTGTAAVLVNSGGTLAGNGFISGAVNVTGGTLAPGNSIDSLDTGALSFTGGTFAAEINTATSAADLVNVAGNLNLGGNPTLTLTDLGGNATLLPGTVLTLIDYSGSWNSGIFNGYADDSTFTFGANSFKIDYNDPNFGGSALTLTVTAIPEPSTFALGGLALLGFAGVGLRRRRATKL